MGIKKLRHDESGLATMLIVLVIITILTLIAISFAQISRREERQALDRQLSSQAYYAAESGINDAVTAIKSGWAAKRKDKCAPFNPGESGSTALLTGSASNQLSGNRVTYSCLLVNPAPDDLVYGNVKQEVPTVIPIYPQLTVGQTLGSIFIGWEDLDAANVSFRPNTNSQELPPKASWGNTTGIVRVNLMGTKGANGLTQSNLLANARTYFLYPRAQTATNITYPGEGGDIAFGGCVPTPAGRKKAKCEVKIIMTGYGVAGPTAAEPIAYIAVSSVYKPVRITVRAEDTAGNIVSLGRVQIAIDSTGQAQDVKRRVQVRLPYVNQYGGVVAAIESMDSLCKRFGTDPIDTSADDIVGSNCQSLGQ